MIHRRKLVVLALAISSAVISAASAEAGWPWAQRQSWEKSNAYVPETHEYLVVSPTPVEPQAPLAACDAAKQRPLWEVKRTTPQAYPWGWFGTRTSQQSMTHTSYYGSYHDRKLLRAW